ncbi:MAG: hypothetical protein ACR2NN_00490 [Bryobacteraceae bacterium]
MTRLSRAAPTTALAHLLQSVDFKNSLHLSEETVQQPKLATRDRMIAATVAATTIIAPGTVYVTGSSA